MAGAAPGCQNVGTLRWTRRLKSLVPRGATSAAGVVSIVEPAK
jgi:hypothetical protein